MPTNLEKIQAEMINDRDAEIARLLAELRSRQSSGGPGEWVYPPRGGWTKDSLPVDGDVIEFSSYDLGEKIELSRFFVKDFPIPAKSIEAAVDAAWRQISGSIGGWTEDKFRETLLRHLSPIHPATAAAAEEVEKLRAENERLTAELKMWKPMTNEEAEAALAEAEAVPMSEAEIDEIVKRATDPAAVATNSEYAQMAAEIKRLQRRCDLFHKGVKRSSDLFAWCVENLENFPPLEGKWTDDVKLRLKSVSTLSRAAEEASGKINTWLDNYKSRERDGYYERELRTIADSLAQPQSGPPTFADSESQREFQDSEAKPYREPQSGEKASEPERDTGWVEAASAEWFEQNQSRLHPYITLEVFQSSLRYWMLRHMPQEIDERAVIERCIEACTRARHYADGPAGIMAVDAAIENIRKLPVTGTAKQSRPCWIQFDALGSIVWVGLEDKPPVAYFRAHVRGVLSWDEAQVIEAKEAKEA